MKRLAHLPPSAGIAIGPILFIIALLAILAAAIAAGSGSFTGSTSTEQAKLLATTILEQAQNLDNAVNLVRGHGYTDQQISFEISASSPFNGYTSGMYYGAQALSTTLCNSDACKVFTPTGGGITPQAIPEDALDQTAKTDLGLCDPNNDLPCRSPYIQPYRFQIEGTAPPIRLFYSTFAPLTKEVCMKINDLVGIANPNNDAPIDGMFQGGEIAGYGGFDTTFYWLAGTGTASYAATATFTAHKDFCYYDSDWTKYVYGHIFK